MINSQTRVLYQRSTNVRTHNILNKYSETFFRSFVLLGIFLKTIFEIFLQPRSSIKRVFSKKKKRTSISLDRLISIDSRQDGRIDTATRNSAEAIESWRSPMRIARGEEGGQEALYRAVETVFIQ